MTALTVVCSSMISDTQVAYGSCPPRHGKSRLPTSYQSNKRDPMVSVISAESGNSNNAHRPDDGLSQSCSSFNRCKPLLKMSTSSPTATGPSAYPLDSRG